ncbi:MAG: tetratricopeptide repeat protein [Treponema sp.]|jgi:tetratricopeptide (TPR) repeat protein|nr:tetratricopeptide repeat protein [Treponema sp.]
MTSSEYYIRGLELMNKGDFDGAIEDFKAAIKMESDYPVAKNKLYWAFCNRGNVYRNKMKLDLAIADYTEAIKLDPNNFAAFNYRGISHDMKNESEKAIADWEVVLKFKPDDATTKELIDMARKALGK